VTGQENVPAGDGRRGGDIRRRPSCVGPFRHRTLPRRVVSLSARFVCGPLVIRGRGQILGLAGHMPFEPKTLVPSGSGPEALPSAFESAVAGGVTVLEAPSGYVLSEGLASAFARMGRNPLWLRLGPEDRDPGTFLMSLVTAAQRSSSDAGQATLKLMRARPGPVFGWPPLFAQLARELRDDMAGRGALVLEGAHQAWAGSPTLSCVGADLLPEFEGVAPCVILAHRVPWPAGTWKGKRRSASELRLPPQTVEWMLDEYAPALTRRARDRAVTLIGGRAAVVAGLRSFRTATGNSLEPVFEGATRWEEVLARLAQALLANVGSEARRRLSLAARTEYAHLDRAPVLFAGSDLPAGPWLQHLENGWVRVRTCWRAPLREVLGPVAEPGRDTLHQAAEWLFQAGADDQAISLYLEIGDPDCAARAITSRATNLMDQGQWATLETWLAQLPDDVLTSHSDLIYCKADIAAACGQVETAQRWFEISASHCSKRNDVAGASRSMLAASAVAAAHGNFAAALSHASVVSSLAEGSDLTTVRMWASWQQGRLQLMSGDTDGALVSFSRAASAESAARESAAMQPVALAGDLAMQLGELRRQQESHRVAEAALKQAEHEALNQLLADVRTPAWDSDDVLGACGWSGAPAPLKLPGLSAPGIPAPAIRARSRIRFWRSVRPSRQTEATPRTRLAGPGGHLVTAVPAAVQDPPVVTELRAPLRQSPAARRRASPAELAVHLLGPLCVAVDDVPVGDWPSARCRSLFGYLLTHREPWPPREVLMELFWPGSPPPASRNSLNVAIHGLRRTLRTVTVLPVILHNGGAYGIHPDLQLWLDIEEFESRVQNGRSREEAGDADRATREYESADGLYRGDFLADGLYEEWAALTRDRLRLSHLDALSRLSNLHFSAGRYAACAAICQRIIECDPCREDAHRRLMRCYSRQGQPHLALLQYRACAEALAAELGVDADPATANLYDQIRRHEPV
jgi:DNA-binding SARP family transcriptional activator